jgi:hypothetical protein
MPDCCPVKSDTNKPESGPMAKTKIDFIIDKAKNFKDYLNSYKPDESIQVYINGFDEKMVIPTILTAVVPIVKAGKQESAVIDLMKKLTVPEGQEDEVKNKLIRYMEMFAKVMMA